MSYTQVTTVIDKSYVHTSFHQPAVQILKPHLVEEMTGVEKVIDYSPTAMFDHIDALIKANLAVAGK